MQVARVCGHHRDLMRLKANHAIHALQTSQVTLKALAEELGFADEHSFSKAFARAVGASPNVYLGRTRSRRAPS